MPMEQGKGIRFFVYVIESPSEVDIYHDTSEGEMIARSLKLQRIPCVRKVVISKTAFEVALVVGLVEQMKVFPNHFPLIHISTHGDVEGIQLSNKETLRWYALRQLLLPTNRALDGVMLLCMSCCEGYAASRMAMYPDATEHPFYSMVANSGKPTWGETAVAFSSFYHLLSKGYYVYEAVEAMKVASGNKNWIHTTSEAEQQGYIAFLKQRQADLRRDQLVASLSQIQPSADAKAMSKKS